MVSVRMPCRIRIALKDLPEDEERDLWMDVENQKEEARPCEPYQPHSDTCVCVCATHQHSCKCLCNTVAQLPVTCGAQAAGSPIH